eukprot:403372804
MSDCELEKMESIGSVVAGREFTKPAQSQMLSQNNNNYLINHKSTLLTKHQNPISDNQSQQEKQKLLRDSCTSLNKEGQQRLLNDSYLQFYFKDIILQRAVYSKRMWKREKISSTDRLTSDSCFPTIEFSASLINRLVQKYSKSLLDQVVLTVETEQDITPNLQSQRLIFTNLSEDTNYQSKKIDNKYKSLKVYLNSSFSTRAQTQDFLKIAQDHQTEITGMKCTQFGQGIDKENININFEKLKQNSEIINNEQLATPFDFLSLQSNFSICRSKGKVDVTLNIIAPNVSFDFYQISSLQLYNGSFHKLSVKDYNEVQTGYLSIDQDCKIVTFNNNDSDVMRNDIVGIWLSNLIDQSESSSQTNQVTSIMRHPLVWAACMNFIFKSERLSQINSPSSDKNTFLVVHYEQNFQKSTFFEFKILRNDAERSYLNNWVVIQAQKRLNRLEKEPYYESVQIKPQIFKKQTTIDMDKYRMFTFNKYIQKLQEIQDQDNDKVRQTQPKNVLTSSTNTKTHSESRQRNVSKSQGGKQISQSAKRVDRGQRRNDKLLNQSGQDQSICQNSSSVANSQISSKKMGDDLGKYTSQKSKLVRSNSQKAFNKVRDLDNGSQTKPDGKLFKRSGSEYNLTIETDQEGYQKKNKKLKIKNQSQNISNSKEDLSQAKNATQNNNENQSQSNFIQMIGGISQRQNLNIGRYVPTLKKSQIQQNMNQNAGQAYQIRQSQQSSVVGTSQVSPFINKSQKNNYMRTSNEKLLQGIVTQSNQMFSPSTVNMATPQNRDFDLRASLKSTVLRQHRESKENSLENLCLYSDISKNQLVAVKGSFTDFQTPNLESKIIQLQHKDFKTQEVFSSQPGYNQETNIQKKLKFDEIKEQIAKPNFEKNNSHEIVDYSEVIEKTNASPTTKNIMKSQAKSIKMLQQQVGQLTKLVQDLATKNSQGNNSSKNSSNNSNSGYSNLFSTGVTVTQKSKSIEKEHEDFQGLAKINSVDQRSSQPNQQSPERQNSGNEQKLIQAFVDYLRTSQQTNGQNNLLSMLSQQMNQYDQQFNQNGDIKLDQQLSQTQQFKQAQNGNKLAPPKILRPMSGQIQMKNGLQNSRNVLKSSIQSQSNNENQAHTLMLKSPEKSSNYQRQSIEEDRISLQPQVHIDSKESFAKTMINDISQQNIMLDFFQESPINHKNSSTILLDNLMNQTESMINSQLIQEESHCIQKLTKVLSQKIEQSERQKIRSQNIEIQQFEVQQPSKKQQNPVFEIQADINFKKNTSSEQNSRDNKKLFKNNNNQIQGLVFEFDESLDETSRNQDSNYCKQNTQKFRKSIEGHQADDENETFKSSIENSLAPNQLQQVNNQKPKRL